MKLIISFLKRYWFLALFASGLMVAEVFVDLCQPRMMEIIVDRGILGIGNGGVPDPGLVASTGVKMILVVLCGGLCGVLSGVFTNVSGQSYGNDLRKACFSGTLVPLIVAVQFPGNEKFRSSQQKVPQLNFL